MKTYQVVDQEEREDWEWNFLIFEIILVVMVINTAGVILGDWYF